MNFHTILPELEITPEDHTVLLQTFKEFQHTEEQYITQSDEAVPLWLMSNYTRPSVIHRLESKLRHVRNSYFLRNMGTTRHRDYLRQSVISFVLSAPEDIPTTVYADDGETVVGHIYYKKYDAVFWDVTRFHEVQRPSPERIFFQIEMDRKYSYTDYMKMYEEGDLFRW